MSSDTSVIFRLNLRRFTLMKENLVNVFFFCIIVQSRENQYIAYLSCY